MNYLDTFQLYLDTEQRTDYRGIIILKHSIRDQIDQQDVVPHRSNNPVAYVQ